MKLVSTSYGLDLEPRGRYYPGCTVSVLTEFGALSGHGSGLGWLWFRCSTIPTISAQTELGRQRSIQSTNKSAYSLTSEWIDESPCSFELSCTFGHNLVGHPRAFLICLQEPNLRGHCAIVSFVFLLDNGAIWHWVGRGYWVLPRRRRGMQW